MVSLKEVYEKELNHISDMNIESSNFTTKPLMYDGVISPNSSICVQPIFNVDFSLDKDGTNKIISMLQSKLDVKSDKELNNLLGMLFDIYAVSEEFLGGHGNHSDRKNEYLSNNCHLDLSNMEGKKIGVCAERTAIGHQLFTLLEKAGITKFKSYFTSSHIAVEGENDKFPHAFIVLKHNTDSKRQYLFDIENLLTITFEDNNKPFRGVGLYYLTEEEFNAFKDGKTISPISVYEKMGNLKVLDKKRYYGDEDLDRNIEELI